MKEIPLTQGYVAIVDDEDYEILSKYTWHVLKSGGHNIRYAGRTLPDTIPASVTNMMMHRQILNPPFGMVSDHINGDGLDNRRSNLRIVTQRQNCQNRRANVSSKYPGVSWVKSRNRWSVYITLSNHHKYIGIFESEEDASLVYRSAVRVYAGDTPL